MKEKPLKQSTDADVPEVTTSELVAEALARQAARRPAKSPPKAMPVTPTLPRQPKPHKKYR
jgi:hypothetical protein